MARKVYYHGTSADCLDAILKKGIQPIPCISRYWTDSYPNHVYMWDDVATDGSGFHYAAESACTPLIFAKDKRIVVFKVIMPDGDVSEDFSGPNMADQGAVQVDKVPRRYIQEYTITEDLSAFVPFFARDYFSNPSAKQHLKTEPMSWAIEHLGEDSWLMLSDMPIKWTTVNLKNNPDEQSKKTKGLHLSYQS